jgi:large subunit ribosomal protein L35
LGEAGKVPGLMPKMKSKSGAKKRFRATGGKKIKRNTRGRRHILTKKATKRKRQLRSNSYVHETQDHQVRAMLPYL